VILAIEIARTIVRTIAETQGTETGTIITLAIETFRTIGVVRTVETEAKVTLAIGTIGTIKAAETGAGTGIALGIEAFSSYARLNKNSR
jgi:hypothetical protein